MSESRKNHISLYEQGMLNRLDAEKQRPVILDRFWVERIVSRKDRSIAPIKRFLKGRPPEKMDREKWANIVESEFTLLLKYNDKQKFLNLFQHISDSEILKIDEGENFGISLQNLQRIDLSKPLSQHDKTDIKRYFSDKKQLEATVVISAQGELAKFSSAGLQPDTVFSIHSVGKIFTGIIILDLIHRGILPEKALGERIEISESAKQKLAKVAPVVLERLNSETLTLHDVMLHKGGFGDFVGKYVDVIQAALNQKNENPDIPKINSIEDFLQYVKNEVSKDEKTQEYSNLAFLFVGLAAEHAYAAYQKQHKDELPALDFNGLLRTFIQMPSGMSHLTDQAPKGAKVNERKVVASPNEPTPESLHLVGNPSGGYWTSADDLRKFGEWLYAKCQREPNFRRLVETYGQEFCSNQLISHQGENPSASAMLSVSLNDGRVIAALSNSGRRDAHELEEAIRTGIFSRNALDSALKTEAGAIDLTKAERFAEGGTHVLYRFPDAPFVIKLMKQNPTRKELDELEKKYAVLYDCFDKDGKQRCIREQHITHQVLLPGKEPYDAALSLVPYEKCFKAKTKFDFKMEPAELDPYLVEQHQELFSRSNAVLINGDTQGVDFKPNDYTPIDERIGAILKRLDTDPKLREAMIEFLTNYREFYQKTNIILDAMGFENILFYKDASGDWQYKVGSAIKHDTGRYTNELYNRIHAGTEAVNLNEFVNFTHAYFSPANIRAVNACALKLNLEPVINDVSIKTEALFTVSQQLSVPQRMLAYAQHGDFEKMNQILNENIKELSFNLGNHWAYSRIADEYIKHGQQPEALKSYLDRVSSLRVELPIKRKNATPDKESKRMDNVERIEHSKQNIIDRRKMLDKKVLLHHELKTPPTLKDHRRSHVSATAASKNKASGSSTKSIMGIVLKPSGKVVPPKPKTITTDSQTIHHRDEPAKNKKPGLRASAHKTPQPQSISKSAAENAVDTSSKSTSDQSASTAPKPAGYSIVLTRGSRKK